MDSGHTREEANAPSYDSSDEWEIGLGNLIIDLDADLEKDGHQEGAVPLDASPMKVGKMKIKRKVSSCAAKSERASPVTIRKDSSASTSGAPTPEEPSITLPEVDYLTKTEDKSGKAPATVVAVSGGQSVDIESSSSNSSNNSSGSSSSSCSSSSNNSNNSGSKKEVIPSQKQDIPAGMATPLVGIKPVTTSHNLQQQNMVVGVGVPSGPSVAGTGVPQAAPARPSSAPNPTSQVTMQQKQYHQQQQLLASPAAREAEGEELTGRKMKIERDSKGQAEAGKKGGDVGSLGRKHGGKKAKVDKAVRHSVGVDTMDIGLSTEPENIGPCEPGTSVNLEGIVWHETDQGVLVVNVTWRNKTYVGTLMDCTRHDWAAPRFCDSPTSDLEGRGSGRPKRGRNSNSSSGDLSNYTETRSSIHSKLRNSTKGRRGSNASSGTRTPPCMVGKNAGKRKIKEGDLEDSPQSSKRQKTSSRQNSSSASEGRNTPVLIECPEPNCSKKYKHKNGLQYHLSHTHHNSLDKDGNWREQPEDGDDDSKSNTSDDVPSVQPKDRKEYKDKSDSSKEDERMDVDKNALSGKSREVSEDESVSHCSPVASPEGSVDSSGDGGASQKKGDTIKGREITKSPKALKNQFDKFTAGMKCLGIPKPKEGKSSPAKTPRSDTAADKAGKSIKKQLAPNSDKDMSIFDFNFTGEIDAQRTEEMQFGNPNDKHVSVSVIRPTPETSSIKSEPTSPTIFAKVSDHTKGPKSVQSSTSSNSEQGTDDKGSRKTEKDKSKSDKYKKPKHDKVVVKTGKTIRPIAPAPPPVSSPTPAPPPQLIAIPTSLVQNSVAVTCALSVPTMNTAMAKPQVMAASPSLKPIQPKPVPTSSVASQEASSSMSVAKDKDKKLKPKKKLKNDKEKDGEKLTGSLLDGSKQTKEQQPEQRPNNILLPAVPETNILKQALTASGIVELESKDSSKVSTPEPQKQDDSKSDASTDRITKELGSSQEKSVSTPLVTGLGMPQIPKLIPTSSVTVPSCSRPSKQLVLPLQQPPLPTQQVSQQLQPQLSQTHPHQQPLSLPTSMKLSVGMLDTAIQDRPSSNLSFHTALGKEGLKNSLLLSPPSGYRTGNVSPAYSDISEDGADEQSKQTKTAESFPFHGGLVKASVNPTLRGTDDNTGLEQHMPIFHPADRKATTGGSIVQGKPIQDRDDRNISDSKDQGSQKHPSLNQTLPTTVPMYSGGHYPYLHGYVNMDPNYHMHLMTTDPQYRQQQEKPLEEQRKGPEKLRIQDSSDGTSESKTDSSDRPVVNLQTEPITPPQASRPDGRDKVREKEQITKSRHLDFQKKEGVSTGTTRTPDIMLAERQREDMRQYYLYQQKLMEQNRQVDEQRKTSEQENQRKDSAELTKRESVDTDHVSKSRTSTPTARNVSTPSKEQSCRKNADAEKRDSKSPLAKGPKVDGKGVDSRKHVEGYSYLQSPYPYGAIPFDPTHPPPFQTMMYPAFLHPDLHYPPTSAVGPSWKPPGDKPGFEADRKEGSPSPHSLSLSTKGGKSPDEPARALDVLQQHANQYFSPPPPQKHCSTSRPRSPEQGSSTPGPRSRSSSPAARNTPETTSSSSSSTSSLSSNRDERRSQPTVHQHMHTHQHTHVGVGYPVLPPYHDPYVIASQQAAAAAAATASAATVPYPVRRDKP